MSILWSAKEIEVLKKLVNAKVTNQEMAKVFPSRSRHAIEQKIYDLGLSNTRTLEADINYEAFTKLIKSARRSKCL
jgi:hypothetical protein